MIFSPLIKLTAKRTAAMATKHERKGNYADLTRVVRSISAAYPGVAGFTERTSARDGIGSSSFISKVCRMINWILPVAVCLARSAFASPSLFPGPLASRRGDRIISEAFTRFLPPSPGLASLPSFLSLSCARTRGHRLAESP